MRELEIASPVFQNNGLIPRKYTCDGDDMNPPLTIRGTPEGTESLVLTVDDPDAPMKTRDHWVVWNISPTEKIEENKALGIEGLNDFNKHSYGGPCPHSGTHRYFFKVYALDAKLYLPPNSRKKDVEEVMKRHIIAKGEIIGLYRRK